VKRTIVIIVLALIIAGIAYVQALFSKQERPSGKNERMISADVLKDYLSRADVDSMMDSLRMFYTDSLQAVFADSLETSSHMASTGVDSLAGEIARLKKQLKTAENKVKNIENTSRSQKNLLIYSFYSNEVSSLPADLSDYERSVSIKEIKSKAIKYFGINSKTLNKIIAKGK